MPSKGELREEAEALGVEVDPAWTKAELEDVIQAAMASDEFSADEPEGEEPDSTPEPPAVTESVKCDNCSRPATFVSDGRSASVVRLCAKHAPR